MASLTPSRRRQIARAWHRSGMAHMSCKTPAILRGWIPYIQFTQNDLYISGKKSFRFRRAFRICIMGHNIWKKTTLYDVFTNLAFRSRMEKWYHPHRQDSWVSSAATTPSWTAASSSPDIAACDGMVRFQLKHPKQDFLWPCAYWSIPGLMTEITKMFLHNLEVISSFRQLGGPENPTKSHNFWGRALQPLKTLYRTFLQLLPEYVVVSDTVT